MEPVYKLPTDTPQHIMEMQTAIILQKTPMERLQMCADMTEFSLNMLKRHIKAEHPDMSEGQLKFEMIKSLYADCFSEEEMKRIEKHFASL